MCIVQDWEMSFLHVACNDLHVLHTVSTMHVMCYLQSCATCFMLCATRVHVSCSVVSVHSSKRELLQTEGTVILHITNALKQDQELRKVFTKSLKV